MEVRPLRPGDDRSAFRSGNVDLDRFLAQYAGQNQFRHHIGVTYVAAEGPRILGYVTVAPSELGTEAASTALRRRVPRYPLPVLRVARLAVALDAQGTGVGDALLRQACGLALELSSRFGGVGLVVDAKPEAIAFYARYGFQVLAVVEGALPSPPEPTPMFLPLALIAAVLGARA